MSFEVIVAGGFVLVMIAACVVTLVLAFQSGKTSSTRKESEDATKRLERHNDPLPTDADYVNRLRRAQERLARLRNRAAKR